MRVGSDVLHFVYDASGRPMAVTYNGTNYYYVTNLQGDVVAILNEEGTAVVTYTYDAWGNILTTGGEMADTLGAVNPLRYRGYVYDQETGLYYLQSRYYDPDTGRFINADVYAATGQGFTGNNMFAYCLNNPVATYDTSGTLATSILIGGAVAATVISGISNAIATATNGGSVKECLIAGVVGAAGGLAGFGLAAVLGFSTWGNLAGRALATTISDLGTAQVLNKQLTSTDMIYWGVDLVIDVTYSTIGYYYTNSVSNFIAQTAVSSIVDGVTDIAETVLFFSNTSNTSSYVGASLQPTNISSTIPTYKGGINNRVILPI